MSHHCHAIDCETAVPPEMFMCKKHWFMLPQAMRNRIWTTYRAGQCDDWNPSAAYCEAAKACLKYITEKEGKTVADDHPSLLLYEMFKPVTQAAKEEA